MPLIAMLLLIAGSCKKQVINSGNQTTAAPPLIYVIVDKNGNNILTSPNDSLTFVYNNNNKFNDAIIDLNLVQGNLSQDYLSLYKKYNDVLANDSKMIQLSLGIVSPNSTTLTTPVHTFNLIFNGQSLGTIYFEYLQQHTNWQEAKVFTFNNLQVKMDSTSGAHIYVIQL